MLEIKNIYKTFNAGTINEKQYISGNGRYNLRRVFLKFHLRASFFPLKTNFL